nr:conjugal transfer protein TraF [Hyphomonas sp.]
MPPDSAAVRAFAACLGALACLTAQAAPAQAQEQRPSNDAEAQDSFYCQERKLGYWFYCTRPKPPEKTAPTTAPSATNQLDAITATLRELKAKAILEPTPANVTAYMISGPLRPAANMKPKCPRSWLPRVKLARLRFIEPSLDGSLHKAEFRAPSGVGTACAVTQLMVRMARE